MGKRTYTKKDIEFLESIVCDIYRKTRELDEKLERHFTIDGHLAGSIGEVYASYYYDIDLSKANTPKHDGTKGIKNIQIKMTQRNSVDIKGTPDYLIVLHIKISEKEVQVSEVYNGPGIIAIDGRKENTNKWVTISLGILSKLDKTIYDNQRISSMHMISKYKP